MTEQTNNKTEERKNRFSGESFMLTPAEAIKHDRIFINELCATLEKSLSALNKAVGELQATEYERDINAK